MRAAPELRHRRPRLRPRDSGHHPASRFLPAPLYAGGAQLAALHRRTARLGVDVERALGREDRHRPSAEPEELPEDIPFPVEDGQQPRAFPEVEPPYHGPIGAVPFGGDPPAQQVVAVAGKEPAGAVVMDGRERAVGVPFVAVPAVGEPAACGDRGSGAGKRSSQRGVAAGAR